MWPATDSELVESCSDDPVQVAAAKVGCSGKGAGRAVQGGATLQPGTNSSCRVNASTIRMAEIHAC